VRFANAPLGALIGNLLLALLGLAPSGCLRARKA